MSRALLDINVLIALLDAQHIHHGNAHHWLANNIDTGWASCPLTQNGCIRILSQPAYPSPVAPAAAADRLKAACNTQWHEFWPDEVSLPEDSAIRWRHILGNRQITDVYLLALAVRRNGRFVTLDRTVALDAVAGASPAHLTVIGPHAE